MVGRPPFTLSSSVFKWQRLETPAGRRAARPSVKWISDSPVNPTWAAPSSPPARGAGGPSGRSPLLHAQRPHFVILRADCEHLQSPRLLFSSSSAYCSPLEPCNNKVNGVIFKRPACVNTVTPRCTPDGAIGSNRDRAQTKALTKYEERYSKFFLCLLSRWFSPSVDRTLLSTHSEPVVLMLSRLYQTKHA